MGTTVRAGQSVFARSTPSKAKAKKGGAQRTAAPSTRSATGDLWNGFEPGSTSSVFAAESSAATTDGNGTSVATGMAVLGLALAGLTGGLLMVGLRRRRAEARSATDGSGRTEV